MARRRCRPRPTQDKTLTPVAPRCPHRTITTLDAVTRFILRIRRCPNPDCSTFNPENAHCRQGELFERAGLLRTFSRISKFVCPTSPVSWSSRLLTLSSPTVLRSRALPHSAKQFLRRNQRLRRGFRGGLLATAARTTTSPPCPPRGAGEVSRRRQAHHTNENILEVHGDPPHASSVPTWKTIKAAT
jgi:hypothetical protein